ncbi:acyl-dehydrogenase domain-containing protein [Cyclospora cayetanensis]|uniref:Acyl-dehydrogenase domain-containing protein n=1 Tax=Cyclospora cayetanensis TaxID=88456 RepID=A0A1D3CSJ0_9EIME|nr:acyl-dehydrogenase domain-containing protein [Cyclospora cayetanensis]
MAANTQRTPASRTEVTRAQHKVLDGFSFLELHTDLNPSEEKLRRHIRSICEAQIRPFAARIWDAAIFDRRVLGACKDMGPAGLQIKGFGCAGLSNVEACLCVMEMARVDASLATFAVVHSGLAMKAIAVAGTEEQKRFWLPQARPFRSLGALCSLLVSGFPGVLVLFLLSHSYPFSCFHVTRAFSVPIQTALPRYGRELCFCPRWCVLLQMARWDKIGCFCLTEAEHGSDAAGLETTAKRTKGGFLLNGNKRWIGNATICDVAVVWAREVESGKVEGFLVERHFPGFKAEAIKEKASLRGVENADIWFSDCFVPDSHKMKPGGFSGNTKLVLESSRALVAAACSGLLIGAYDSALEYCSARQQFGRPLTGFQLVQERLLRALGLAHVQFLPLKASRDERFRQLSLAPRMLHDVHTAGSTNGYGQNLDALDSFGEGNDFATGARGRAALQRSDGWQRYRAA